MHLHELPHLDSATLANIVRSGGENAHLALREIEIRADRWAAIYSAAQDDRSAADLAEAVYSHTTEWHTPVPLGDLAGR